MKHIIVAVLCSLSLSIKLSAQSVTFSEHIAPIIYNQCTRCHREGEIAPFPMTNYDEVVAWGDMVQYVTSIGYMPPWKPDPSYQEYQKENYLTADQKQKISDWVNQGMPQGDPNLEPDLPVFPNGSQIGVPDLVVPFAQAYTHQGNNYDEYRYFALPTGLTEDKNIRALEFRPGNKQIVHHALIWEDTTGEAAAADAQTPEYGYTGGQGGAGSLSQTQLPGYVPGALPLIYSNGITQRLHAGSYLKVQLHYAPTPVDESDSSVVNIFFENNQANRLLQNYIMLPTAGTLVNGPFIIPPNETREFHGTFTVPFDVSLYGIAPHCHKLGTHWEVYAVKPNGDTINLIRINDWDFNWQGSFQFKQLLKIPAGSVLHALAGYDNTINNPVNPNNPPQTVSWGEGTADEMFYLPFLYLPYQPGDENIVFEDDNGIVNLPFTLQKTEDKLYPVNPQPANESVKYGFTLAEGKKVQIQLLSLDGKVIAKEIDNGFHLPGYHVKELNCASLPSGIYLLEFTAGNMRQTQKLVVQH
ncbi:MAG: T9SS type A sorting domain-containing protein [Bacteroidia bacterium]